MSYIASCKLMPRLRKTDDRGWFVKLLTGTEEHLPPGTGEIYMVSALPGMVRGGHFHNDANEWFVVIRGCALATLCDPATGDTRRLLLSAGLPRTLFVPHGIAHSFLNVAENGDELWLVAYSDRQYEASDTIPYVLSDPVADQSGSR